MISKRAPEQVAQADAVLDDFLNRALGRKKRDQRLRRIVAEIPPREIPPVDVCGCFRCLRLQPVMLNPTEGEDGA